MKGSNLLVVFNTQNDSGLAAEHVIAGLQWILQSVFTPDHFCNTHELVDRNRITSKENKILREASYRNLRTFRFLINKN